MPPQDVEKFRVALERLATCPGDVRSRLKVAFCNINAFNDDELPAHLRADFIWIRKHLVAKGWYPNSPPRIDATLYGMWNKTGEKIAKRLFDLCMELIWLDKGK